MLKEKFIFATPYLASTFSILGGIIFLVLGYIGILPFDLEHIFQDVIFISFGIIILIYLIKSEYIKNNWANGTVIYNFYFLSFTMVVIRGIITIMFLPDLKNLFIVIITIILIFILYKAMKEFIGSFIKFHFLPSGLIVNFIEKILKSKKYKYIKKGPKKASISNLMAFDERIYIKEFDIVITISSYGIIIGKRKASNEKKIIWLLKIINRKLENVSK